MEVGRKGGGIVGTVLMYEILRKKLGCKTLMQLLSPYQRTKMQSEKVNINPDSEVINGYVTK